MWLTVKGLIAQFGPEKLKGVTAATVSLETPCLVSDLVSRVTINAVFPEARIISPSSNQSIPCSFS